MQKKNMSFSLSPPFEASRGGVRGGVSIFFADEHEKNMQSFLSIWSEKQGETTPNAPHFHTSDHRLQESCVATVGLLKNKCKTINVRL
jgi:hypothetical protein